MMLLNQPQELMERAAIKVIGEALSVRQTEELVHEMLAPVEPMAQTIEKPRDPNVRAAETALQSALGCKVEITDRGGRGKIVIHYAALEDFDRIMEQLGAQ
jgi:ParB family chromosome partitioning protein